MSADPDRQRRRRFPRATPGAPESSDAREALEAEVVLLREENARLKAARHQRQHVGELLERTRSMRSEGLDRDSLGDETAQMLVEGLVIRESLLEICQEIERSMVVFGARLEALSSAADQLVPLRSRPDADDDDG
jgi:hypothetical protein